MARRLLLASMLLLVLPLGPAARAEVHPSWDRIERDDDLRISLVTFGSAAGPVKDVAPAAEVDLAQPASRRS